MRATIALVSMLTAVAPLAGQEQAADAFPEGWTVRLDYPDRGSLDDVEFVTMGSGYHVTLGPRAIFYRSSDVARGEYTAHATFTQTAEVEHPEAYGLFIGGRNLEGADQDYLYFLVRQDGSYLVKHRGGEETHTLIEWTKHEAVSMPDESGRSTNALRVAVAAEGVRFFVNDEEVAELERVSYMNTDGIFGLRVNHRLDLHVADFGVDRGDAAAAASR